MRLRNDLIILGDADDTEDRRLAMDAARQTLDLLHDRLNFRAGDAAAAPAPPAFRNALAPVIDAYLAAHSALASDDLAAAQSAATALADMWSAVPSDSPNDSERNRWESLRAIGVTAIDACKDAKDIEEYRKQFKDISDALIEALRRFGMPDGIALHVTHCPMAFDNTGADWLQRDTAVLNPYFGSAMLNCGESTGTLTPPAAQAPASSHEVHEHGEGTAHE
ncbi:MAG: DUF3347 domain-containing protein [Candidatus Hydrogenedentes bacterium]|nr:DUF3347 domain-containing protein [Candidatus Hydrogenedentota bacterium]